jgi:hypothetical protein
MMLGMSLATFTLFHTIISLIGIGTGLIVMSGMWSSNRMPGMTALFLVTTTLTSVTGFMFPFKAFGPPHAVGVLSLIVLVFTVLGVYVYRLVGRWRAIYVYTAVFALYLNVFVLVVQMFQKIPALNQLAPNGNEPPFAVAQGIVLVLFALAGWHSFKKFHPASEIAVIPRSGAPAAKLG